jgi:phosphate starvation-inducible protein PhoH
MVTEIRVKSIYQEEPFQDLRGVVSFKIEGIGIVYLDDKDIVRHRLVKKVLDAYKYTGESK